MRHADTHEQLMIQDPKKRFTIYDEDPYEVFFDLPCDEDMRVTEGVDKGRKDTVAGAIPALEVPWSFSFDGLHWREAQCPGSDYVYAHAQTGILNGRLGKKQRNSR